MHSSFEEMESTAEIYTVISFGCLCQIKEVLDSGKFIDLLEDLCGEVRDGHLDEFQRFD